MSYHTSYTLAIMRHLSIARFKSIYCHPYFMQMCEMASLNGNPLSDKNPLQGIFLKLCNIYLTITPSENLIKLDSHLFYPGGLDLNRQTMCHVGLGNKLLLLPGNYFWVKSKVKSDYWKLLVIPLITPVK